ncbi:MAG: hypothetical protein HUJ54_11600 [Erysipelotrichaceae bacterium]|nr:hypothetical protein [Erysipelotrichaceae bacterium]
MINYLIYASSDKKADTCKSFLSVHGIQEWNDETCFIDSSLRRPYFSMIKESALEINGIVVISSLSELPSPDLVHEIQWFLDNSIRLWVADIKQTHQKRTDKNLESLKLITDVYTSITGSTVTVKNPKGRPQATYPERWAEFYDLWSQRKITAKQFMEYTGLKRTTFYKLINDWEESMNQV